MEAPYGCSSLSGKCQQFSSSVFFELRETVRLQLTHEFSFLFFGVTHLHDKNFLLFVSSEIQWSQLFRLLALHLSWECNYTCSRLAFSTDRVHPMCESVLSPFSSHVYICPRFVRTSCRRSPFVPQNGWLRDLTSKTLSVIIQSSSSRGPLSNASWCLAFVGQLCLTGHVWTPAPQSKSWQDCRSILHNPTRDRIGRQL